MLLEQSYNADAKEESGLDGITWHQNGESFGAIARRYLSNLLEDIPQRTASIHFCCDRYSSDSLKAAQQQHRYGKSQQARV